MPRCASAARATPRFSPTGRPRPSTRCWPTSVRQNGPPLTPPAATPILWRASQIGNLIGVPLALLLLSPFLLLYAPFFLWKLRQRETTDAVIAPRPTPDHVASLSVLEDHDVTNQFSAFGSVKPGFFRLSTLIFVFWVLNFSTRQIYTRGRLARVGTIHFARWVFMDNRRRLLFCSNYDGSLDSYMDDFINKVAFGLNLVFSNGIGWPRTTIPAVWRRAGRADIQILPAAASGAHAGLVQGLSRPDHGGPRSQHANPRRAGAQHDDRRRSTALARTDLRQQHDILQTPNPPTSRACFGQAMAA